MRTRTSSSLLAGAAAGLIVVLLGLLLRGLTAVPTLPELVMDRLVLLTPGALFGLLIDRLQLAGRPLLYSSLLLAELLVLTALGPVVVAFVARRDQVPAGRPARIVGAGLALWLLLGLVVLPLAGDGLFASASPFSPVAVVAGYLLEALVYSVAVVAIWAWLTAWLAARPAAADPVRRQLTAGVAAAALATLGGVAAWRYRVERAPLMAASTPGAAAAAQATTTALAANTAATDTATAATSSVQNSGTSNTQAASSGAASASAGSPAPVTSPADFYLVSKNLQDPVVQAAGWRLKVSGLVKTPLTLTYDELTKLPAVEQYVTLECISNDVGGPLMSNARWRGVPLAALLDRAGADTTAAFVGFQCVDGYTESLPMELARRATTLVTYQMDGQPLPAAHGFPARIILTGRYGMKNPKWLNVITVLKGDQAGFWEHQGWSEQATVRTTSRLDVPKDGTTVPLGSVTVAGPAFAGERGIRGVQLRFTPQGSAAANWVEATVGPALGPSTWVLWTYRWQPPAAGTYQVTARAIDGTGAVQETKTEDSFPNGAAGLHSITVHVR